MKYKDVQHWNVIIHLHPHEKVFNALISDVAAAGDIELRESCSTGGKPKGCQTQVGYGGPVE